MQWFFFSKTEFNVYFQSPLGENASLATQGFFLSMWGEGSLLYHRRVGNGEEPVQAGPGVVVSPLLLHPQRSGWRLRPQSTQGASPLEDSSGPAPFPLFPWPAWGQVALEILGGWFEPHMTLVPSSHSCLVIPPPPQSWPRRSETQGPSADWLPRQIIALPYPLTQRGQGMGPAKLEAQTYPPLSHSPLWMT